MKVRLATILALTGLSFLPALTPAHAQDDLACFADAQVYCGQFIPDRDRVAHCLMANRNRVSPACRKALKRFK